MASEVAICNRALALIGQGKIASLTDPNEVAELCNTLFPSARDKCFEDRKWSFLLARATLASLTVNTPVFGYRNAFEIPADCILIRSVDNSDFSGNLHWVREGDKILADEDVVYITYSRTVENPDLWTNSFIEALTFKLASDLSMPIAENRAMRDTYEQDYYRKIAEASATDGGQGRQERIKSHSLITARLSGRQIR